MYLSDGIHVIQKTANLGSQLQILKDIRFYISWKNLNFVCLKSLPESYQGIVYQWIRLANQWICIESCWVVLSRVESCRVVSSCVKLCQVMSSPVESCQVVLSPVESCRVVSSQVVSSHVKSCRAVSSRVNSCRVKSGRAVSSPVEWSTNPNPKFEFCVSNHNFCKRVILKNLCFSYFSLVLLFLEQKFLLNYQTYRIRKISDKFYFSKT